MALTETGAYLSNLTKLTSAAVVIQPGHNTSETLITKASLQISEERLESSVLRDKSVGSQTCITCTSHSFFVVYISK